MTVRELIKDLLIESGKEKRAMQVYRELEESEYGNTEIGADIPGISEIKYVQSISNELPCFVGLKCEEI